MRWGIAWSFLEEELQHFNYMKVKFFEFIIAISIKRFRSIPCCRDANQIIRKFINYIDFQTDELQNSKKIKPINYDFPRACFKEQDYSLQFIFTKVEKLFSNKLWV
jgi:hypothetical protein